MSSHPSSSIDAPNTPPPILTLDDGKAPPALEVVTPKDAPTTGPKKRIKVRFEGKGDVFHATLTKRVDAYFEENGISKNANLAMMVKTVFWFGFFGAVYAVFLSNLLPLPLLLAWGMLLGFSTAAIGMNIGHDALHGAYSKNPVVNRVLGWSFAMLGAATTNWIAQHNVRHHSYTNIPGHDTDIEPGPFLRFHDYNPIKPFSKYQHLFAWFLYCFTSMNWVFFVDFLELSEKTAASQRKPTRDVVGSIIAAKLFHGTVFIVLPFYFIDLPFYQILLASLFAHAGAGLTLAIVFQLAHVTEGPIMPGVPENGTMGEGFAAHQMRTTINFSPGSFMAQFICGGLNHQVEHHVFPRICHIHYPKLSPIFRETAAEFGVPYLEHKTFLGAVKSHYNVLKMMGRTPGRIAGDGPVLN